MTTTVLTAIGALAALTGTFVWMLKRECVDLAREIPATYILGSCRRALLKNPLRRLLHLSPPLFPSLVPKHFEEGVSEQARRRRFRLFS